MLLLTSSLNSLYLPLLPLRKNKWKARLSTDFRNGFADSLQRLPPFLESAENTSFLRPNLKQELKRAKAAPEQLSKRQSATTLQDLISVSPLNE
jgi:hypothetical protein